MVSGLGGVSARVLGARMCKVRNVVEDEVRSWKKQAVREIIVSHQQQLDKHGRRCAARSLRNYIFGQNLTMISGSDMDIYNT